MPSLDHILDRVRAKEEDYGRYDFSLRENNALKTFFDLSQEFDSLDDFHLLCVAIPKSYFNLEACLYVMDPKLDSIVLAARTEDRGCSIASPPREALQPEERPYYTGDGSLVLTIRGKEPHMDQLPFRTRHNVLGLLEIYPSAGFTEHDELFFEKYANRLGFNIHNRFLMEKNIEHLRFIRSLVADIEHNVIVPNMVYKLFFKRLRGKVMKSVEIEQVISGYASKGRCAQKDIRTVASDVAEVNQGIITELENIEKHYRNMSLFLETLFRRSHFDQGRLTLRTKSCNMNRDVVRPQLDRYLEAFRKAGITIDDRLSGIPDEEFINVVDVGLIAQVYANLFSNALKYSQEVEIFGERKKYVAYGHEIIRDYFGPGRDGAKYNVFSSGPHIPVDERARIFDEEFRGSNVESQPGTGHGLAFVKNAVEIHGGVVGYEATDYGNNFYFILPK